MNQPATHDAPSNLPALHQHKKRKEWGLAILAWERPGKRAYLFEDGELRIIAEGFFSLIQEVDRPRSEVEALCMRLGTDLKAIHGAREAASTTARTSDPVIRFDDQMSFFRSKFPQGFAGDKWTKKQRGKGAKKRLKRHRDAAVEEARQKLSRERLDELLVQLQYRPIWNDVVEVLDNADLVPAAQLKNLDSDVAEDWRALAIAVRDLLWEDGSYEAHFDRFLKTFRATFKKPAPWQLATALSALVHPEEHVCIRPSSFREQAKSMAPRLPMGKTPNASAYARFASMAKTVRDKLESDGLAPRDYLDVYDFVRITLTPKAQKQLRALAAASADRDDAVESREAA